MAQWVQDFDLDGIDVDYEVESNIQDKTVVVFELALLGFLGCGRGRWERRRKGALDAV